MLEIAVLTSKKYSLKDAEMSIASLSQGEIDVLDRVKDALGWHSIKSLAVKYYPACPCRKWWLEALRRSAKFARRTNIVYLLKCLESIQKEWREAAYSGKESLNRLIPKGIKKIKRETIRLEPTNSLPGFANANGREIPLLLRRLAGATF